ncbi:putative membrane protein [Acidovorax sp. 94]|uniref:cyd operon YbgE family protein n=1 Tax=Acidovorax sp. 94 TaxID=2135633 RepID=UPI000F262911|nr:cyd operon YbgE family protein [Acidovorax sp. 94]RKR69363.1 putative membrane protein [Acidovorax sp. 94]
MQKPIPTPAESADANTCATTGSMPGASTHWPSLTAAVMIMVIATLDPRLLAHPSGAADHLLASFLFLAMSAGFVRGVGFIPRWWLWRVLFSGWTCALGLALAAAAKWVH